MVRSSTPLTLILNLAAVLAALSGLGAPVFALAAEVGPARKIEIRHSPVVEQCSTWLLGETTADETLRQLVGFSTTEDHVVATTGTIWDLGSLFLLAKASYKTAALIQKTLIDTLNSPDPILRNLAQRTMAVMDAPDRLLICVTESSCPLRFGRALHAAPVNSFDIGSIVKAEVSGRKPGWLGARASRVSGGPRMILMSSPEPGSTEDLNAATAFIHEATHYADFDLIEIWIDLCLQSKSRDPLFLKYVRVGSDGRATIDEGFLRVFLESRAYYAEIAAFAKDMDVRQILAEQAVLAMKDIHAFSNVTANVVKEYGLTDKNIFAWGASVGKQIESQLLTAGLSLRPEETVQYVTWAAAKPEVEAIAALVKTGGVNAVSEAASRMSNLAFDYYRVDSKDSSINTLMVDGIAVPLFKQIRDGLDPEAAVRAIRALGLVSRRLSANYRFGYVGMVMPDGFRDVVGAPGIDPRVREAAKAEWDFAEIYCSRETRNIFNSNYFDRTRGAAPSAAATNAEKLAALEVLGLRPGATRDQIKTAFRKLSLQFHPDLGHPEYVDRYKKITAAYTLLKN